MSFRFNHWTGIFACNDVPQDFISSLLKRLKQAGINCSMHGIDGSMHGIKKDTSLSETIDHETKFALVVFSKGYAYSERRLNELVKILRPNRYLVIIPIFYINRAAVVGDGEFALDLQNVDERQRKTEWSRPLEEAEKISKDGWKATDKPLSLERNLIDKIVGRLVNKIYSRHGEEFTFGPFGDEGQNEWKFDETNVKGEKNDGKGIIVEYEHFIKSVTFRVGNNTGTKPQNDGKSLFKVKLEDEEYITSFAGSQKKANGDGVLISSLTFRTNKRILGPIGRVKEVEEVEEDKSQKKGKMDKHEERQKKEEDKERQKRERRERRERWEKEEEEEYFSVPLDAGEVTKFYWRKGDKGVFLESVGALVKVHQEDFNPFPSVGLFGTEGDLKQKWKYTNERIRKIVIHIGQKKNKETSAENEENPPSGGPFIQLIEFTGEDGGEPKTHGSQTGLDTKNSLTIELHNGEYLTSISGYYTDNIFRRYRDFGITSLTFRTNKRMAITIGKEEGIYFSSPAMAGRIVGFYGYINEHENLCGIGAYFKPILGQSQFGSWDDGKFDGVKGIRVQGKDNNCSFTLVYDNGSKEDSEFTHPARFSHNTDKKVDLDYPREYLTSISGYKQKNDPISSLTFHSNKQRIPPCGKEGGTYFWYPLAGSRIIGVYGRGPLDYVGVHVKPIPHLYPFRTVGPPMKGSGMFSWDDGVHTNVRGFRVSINGENIDKKFIKSITFIYDNNGSLVRGDQHGKGDASTEDWDLLKFPKVRLLRIEGYMGREGNQTIIHDLAMVSTEGPSPTYASRKDKGSSKPFVIPEGDARIVGFFGTAETYLNSIGARLEPY